MKRFLMRSFMVIAIIFLVWIVVAPGCMTFRKADAEMIKQFDQRGVQLSTVTEKIDGRNLHYAKTGNDSLPTLFFVHGTPGSWDAFAGYMQDQELLKQFRMISVDRPGFGYSDFGKPEKLPRQSELMSPLFYKIANGKPIYLVGHSLGGPMIIKLAADNPGLFAGLIIISGSIDPKAEKPERWRPWLYKTPLNWLVPGAFRASNEELWYLKKDLVELKPDFNKITCPVVFIHGDKDSWVPPANIDYGKKLLVNSKEISVTMFPGANHFIPWTRHNEIRQILLQLGSTPSGSSNAMTNQ
jgi:pimeloyl-ACP methyl ester carboxylesterase